MSKNIVIVGGGISGLSALYYLRRKYAQRCDIHLRLLEMALSAGGTVKTQDQNGCQFETGPNGFLDNKPSTLALVNALGLENQLINATSATKIRYICVKDVLYPLPSGLHSFWNFKPLSFFSKLRVGQEIFIPKGQNSDETVYEFGTRRLGEDFARFFLDPMVSGIFGGNAKDLNLQYAFPRIYQIEQKYGSLFKGMISLGFEKTRKRYKNSLTAGQPTGQLWSLKKGMGQLTQKLAELNSDVIETGVCVQRITAQAHGYQIQALHKTYFADEVVLSVPAPAAADILNDANTDLSDALRRIPYACLIVVGLVYDINQFDQIPQGFGYLRPTHEGREVLGVLFSSNIFRDRCPQGKMLFQMMIGGACNPASLQRGDEELLSMAKQELASILGAHAQPREHFLLRWDKAIPQYDRAYPQTYDAIKKAIDGMPHVHLLANYIGGVSLNDCTANAKHLSESLNI